MAKKFLQMDGTVGDQPDPCWDNEKAMKLGIVPRPTESPLRIFHASVPRRSEEQLNSLGSLRFENEGFGLSLG
jgi:hypothetical protein